MANFVSREFTFRAATSFVFNELHNVFIDGLRFRKEKEYDLTLEDVMADEIIDNQKDSINFLTDYIIQRVKDNEDEDENQDNQVTVTCDRCGKKYIRLFGYDLCPECEKHYYRQACIEDYINWLKPKNVKNQIEIEIGTQRDIRF